MDDRPSSSCAYLENPQGLTPTVAPPPPRTTEPVLGPEPRLAAPRETLPSASAEGPSTDSPIFVPPLAATRELLPSAIAEGRTCAAASEPPSAAQPSVAAPASAPSDAVPLQNGPSPIGEGLVSGDELLDLLASGVRFAEHPELIKGKVRLARQRRRGIERYPLGHQYAGLPVCEPLAFRTAPSRGAVKIAYALWDELTWHVLDMLERVEHKGKIVEYVPCGNDGRARAALDEKAIRALLGWPVSRLYEYSVQLPGRVIDHKIPGKKPHIVVRTFEFLPWIGHPQYPFLVPLYPKMLVSTLKAK